MIFRHMILSLLLGLEIKTFCLSVVFVLVYTVLIIQLDIMGQIDGNIDMQIKVP